MYANDVKCLNPWDVQSCRQYAVDGAFPALQAHQGGRYEGVCFALDSMSSNSMKSGNPHSGFHEETVAKTLQAGGVDPTCNQGGNVIVEAAPMAFHLQQDPISGEISPCIGGQGQASVGVFMGGQGSKAKGIGYSEDAAPTIKSVMSGGNTVPDVVYALQGNGIDRPALVYDARGNGDGETVSTLTGDHQNRVTDYTSVCVMAHGQSNAEITQDMSPTLNCNHEQPIVAMEGSYKGKGHVAEGISPALKAAHPSEIAYGVDCRNAVQAKANGGQSLNCTPSVLTNGKPPRRYIVRRLTPLECCRLQGFPDGWADIDRKDDFTDEELDFWRNVRNTHAAINGKQTKEYTKAQMLKWYNGLQSDSSIYKMWGNGIALPCAQYVMEGIALALKGENMDALRL